MQCIIVYKSNHNCLKNAVNYKCGTLTGSWVHISA